MTQRSLALHILTLSGGKEKNPSFYSLLLHIEILEIPRWLVGAAGGAFEYMWHQGALWHHLRPVCVVIWGLVCLYWKQIYDAEDHNWTPGNAAFNVQCDV